MRVTLAAGQRNNDLLAMEAPVFDEDFTRMVSANHHSRQKYARHIALVRLRIHRWFVCRRVKRNTKRPQELKIRVVPGQRKHLNRRQ